MVKNMKYGAALNFKASCATKIGPQKLKLNVIILYEILSQRDNKPMLYACKLGFNKFRCSGSLSSEKQCIMYVCLSKYCSVLPRFLQEELKLDFGTLNTFALYVNCNWDRILYYPYSSSGYHCWYVTFFKNVCAK